MNDASCKLSCGTVHAQCLSMSRAHAPTTPAHQSLGAMPRQVLSSSAQLACRRIRPAHKDKPVTVYCVYV